MSTTLVTCCLKFVPLTCCAWQLHSSSPCFSPRYSITLAPSRIRGTSAQAFDNCELFFFPLSVHLLPAVCTVSLSLYLQGALNFALMMAQMEGGSPLDYNTITDLFLQVGVSPGLSMTGMHCMQCNAQ